MGVIQYGHPLRPRMGMGFLNSPNMRQDITWTNADPVQWRIFTALMGDELCHDFEIK